MDFLQVVERRRAVRQYRSTPVDRSLIERLINTAVLAPSAMNLQPWAFAVVTGVTRIDELARRAKEYLIAEPRALELPPQAHDMLKDPEVSIFHHAPVLLMVLAKSDDGASAGGLLPGRSDAHARGARCRCGDLLDRFRPAVA